ncbi:ComEC/Rec2 family competence protein [Rhodococcus sp. IEGM 1379]|uniref:ComEC/Rec2 family competence protein n=1 Tax=Rhodococcus sp. IEGM 1379 TaxID=3047086 RepID=UPI0024B7B349|nr:ComEC/Rec2 family competence protein [Rhodococcus sp. IEGM 1379]MDI9919084.1 ComEC/Rec2 family competence protein [Rhodococcus sp. IEGM 1379]
MSGETEQPVLDARLVPAALTVWSVTAAGIVFGSTISWILASVSAAVGICLFVVARRRGYAAWVLVVLVTFVFGTAFSVLTAWRMSEAEAHPLTRAAESGGWVSVQVTPIEDPRVMASSMGPAQVYFRASVRSTTVGNQRFDAGGAVTIRAPGDLWPKTLPGQVLTVRGKVSAPRRSDLTLAVITTEGGPIAVGVAPWYQRWAGTVRSRFAAVCAAALPADQAGLLPGLVVGDTSALSPVVKANFTAAGLSHLTAVSGANISILLGAVLLLVRAASLDPRIGAALAVVTLVAFVIIARPSPSVLRAAVMGTIGLLSLVTGRRKQALPALGCAVIVLVTVMPELAVDWGFVLSTTATGALVILAPVWVDGLRQRGWPRWLAEATAVSGAAFVVTAPVVAAMAGTLSVVAIVANLLVAPVVGVLTVLGALVALLALINAPTATLAAHTVRPPMWWLLSVSERAAAVPGANLTVPSGVLGAVFVVGVLLVAMLLVWNRISRWVIGTFVLGIALALSFQHLFSGGRIAPGWVFVMCDVGQGDGLVLSTGDGRVVVIDVGPDPTSMDRCLNMLGVNDIALVVISHFHADHIGGLEAVLAGRSVSAVGVGPMLLPESGFRDVETVASSKGVPMIGLRSGSEFTLGSVRLNVLGPTVAVPRDRHDAAESANDQSLVLMAHTSAGRILLTGDSEAAGEASILRAGIDVRADILKLPHHGSRTTSDAFLEAVHPRLTLVSVGVGNTFGHPNPAVLGELESWGGAVARTDRDGTFAVYGNGDGSMSVVSVPRGNIFG